MTTESTLSNLQLDLAVLKRQIDTLTAEMQEMKGQRQSLETQHREAQLHLHAMTGQGDAEGVKVATAQVDEIERALIAVEERLQLTNSRVQALQHEHSMTIGAIHRVDAQAANVANRIRLLRSDLTRMQHKQDANSPVVINAIRSIQGDLRASEDKYVAIVGEVLPDEAA